MFFRNSQEAPRTHHPSTATGRQQLGNSTHKSDLSRRQRQWRSFQRRNGLSSTVRSEVFPNSCKDEAFPIGAHVRVNCRTQPPPDGHTVGFWSANSSLNACPSPSSSITLAVQPSSSSTPKFMADLWMKRFLYSAASQGARQCLLTFDISVLII